MTDHDFSAVEQARGLLARPTQLAALRSRRLPPGMRTLLRVAAQDTQVLDMAALRTGDRPNVLREACQFYVQQVLLDEASDSYRILGVEAKSPALEIKAHYGLLMRWMHPDRNPDGWDAVFAERVTRAWNNLRTPDRRAAYDGLLSTSASEFVESEDWAGGAAPYRPIPKAGAKISLFATNKAEWSPPATAKFVVSPRAMTIAAAAGVVMMTLFVAWPSTDVDETPLDTNAARPVASQADFAAPDNRSPDLPSVASDSAPSIRMPPTAVSTRATSPAIAADARVSTTPPPATRLPERASTALPIVVAAVDASSQSTIPAAPPEVPPNAEPPASSLAGVKKTREVSIPDAPAQVVEAALPFSEQDSQLAGIDSDESRTAMAATATATESKAPTEPAAPDLDQAGLLIGRFARAYQRGDIEALSALFAADARSQGGGIVQIREAYDRLFERTAERSISIRNIQWQIVEERALATGRFEISQARDKQSKAEISRGTIRFDIEQREDQLLIARLEHIDRGF